MLIIVFVIIFIIAVVCCVTILKKRGKNDKSSDDFKRFSQEIKTTGISKEKSKTLEKKFDGSTNNLDNKKTDNAVFSQVVLDPKEFLLSLDLGSELTTKLLKQFEEEKNSAQGKTKDVASLLDSVLEKTLNTEPTDTSKKDGINDETSPNTIVFVGVNGVGKTTTLGKIAYLLANEGKSVVLGAADTFRAAAAEQLEVWAKRVQNNSKTSAKIEVVKGNQGDDPASVAYKAAQVAVQNNFDYLLIDTAGRQQTNSDLIAELSKIKRTIEKHTSVNDVYLVIDSTTGQIAANQAKTFNEATNITGIIGTKLDGSAKGGALFLVADQLNVPVKYIGKGEGLEDISRFNCKEFVQSLHS